MSLRDLKGRMPERSKWLLAEGAAKRNPRYRDALFDAKNANIGFLDSDFRVLLFFWGYCSGGYADALPPAKSTRAKALGIQPSGWIPPNATRQYKTQIITNMALINTIMLCKSA